MNRPRRIGLVMQGGAGWMGGLEYVKNLVFALESIRGERPHADEVHLIAGGTLDDGLRAQIAPCVTQLHEGLLQRRDTLAQRLRYLVLGRILRRANARFRDFLREVPLDFLYPLTYDNLYTIGVSLPVGGGFGECRWAGWIPDFQHRHMPQLFNATEIEKRDRGIATLARDAATIVFSSETAARDFAQFCPESTARAEVLRFCTSPQAEWFEADPLEVQRRYELPDTFFLVSNQFWEHKNHLVVFEALQRLAARSLRPVVACTGQPADFRKKGYFDTISQRVRELGIAPQVRFLGLIPRADQIQLMRRSLAVIQPSLFEGWSTVVEDARLLGKPIVLSDIPVHLEQNPPRSRFFAKTSPDALADALADAAEELEPGPHSADEAAARAAATLARLAYGRRFLEIVDRCTA